MTLGPRSLQAQLALRLAVVFLVATVLAVGAVVYEGYSASDALGDEELARRAAELARHVARGADGTARLDLPEGLDQVYHSPSGTDLFAIRTDGGRVLAGSSPDLAAALAGWPPAGSDPRYFRLEGFGPGRQDYYGLAVRADTGAGPVALAVARASDADELAHVLLGEFVRDVAWVIPLFAAATLAVGVWSIRRGLRPVVAASAMAARIAPDATGVRLPEAGLPTELTPLVTAVNRALDRLERGFAAQRQFTANAAHELRTPLAILTAGLEEIEGGPAVARLREDAARMNRLVEQLLRVARLDAMPTDVGSVVDLRASAAAAVEYLAPWAIARGRALGFDAPDGPVRVHGNADAIADALRNLVENAVHHAPPGTEVSVTVGPDGTVTVADRGPGVPAEDRQRIFERFWRGRGERQPGAGLGLAIVAEIAKAHGAAVEVGDAPGGGALFSLRFRP